jgi:drug/metabolite transporter (DMT)-like permease
VAHEHSLRLGLLLDLLRRPRWLLGNLAEVGAVVLQFAALRRGSLVLVQTLLVAGLLFALPLGAALQHRRLSRLDWTGTVAVVVGLGLFVAIGRPTRGRGEAGVGAWVVVLGLGCLVVAGLIVAAPRQPGPNRATLLGGACGVLFGLDAALAKASGHLLDRGVAHVFGAWEPYALAALGAFGFLLAQSAFQAGPLGASLPLITAADPVTAALIGVLAFHERVAGDPAAIAGQALAVVVIVAGVWVLARSPLVTGPPPTGHQ